MSSATICNQALSLQNFSRHLRFKTLRFLLIRDLTILGRRRDGDGQNKLLQINGNKIVRRILSIV